MSSAELLERRRRARPAAGWEAATGRLGLVPRAVLASVGPRDPGLFVIESLPAKTSFYSGVERLGGTGGIGTTPREAMACAVGEALERYCAGFVDPRTVVTATARELGDEAVDFDRFELFSERQYAFPKFPFPRFNGDLPIRWVEGTSLHTGARRYVPACLVYVPYAPIGPHEELFHAISTGQACHADRQRAIGSGLYEVIERDQFCIAWLRGMRLPRFDAWSDPELAALFPLRALAGHPRFHLFDATLDLGVPTYVCLAEAERDGRTLFAAGAATRRSPAAARRKAMLEAAHTLVYSTSLLRARPDWKPASDWSNVSAFADHVRLFAEPGAREHLAFLLDGDAVAVARPEPPTTTPADDVEDCLARVEAAGLEAILVELATADVSALGLSVVKVLIPGSVPLTASVPAVGSRRLTTVPGFAGLECTAASDFNRTPHPFP